MSSDIWTQCAAKFKPSFLTGTVWRMVEDQSRISTRKLVDSDLEQQRLEELLEAEKPPIPTRPEFRNLHYLLFTPFRYPPLNHGSRFGTRQEMGIWYGSFHVEAALAESAYYRLRFLNDTAADISSQTVFTSFEIAIRTALAADLTLPPFDAYTDQISNPTTYAGSQPLGKSMRDSGMQACRYVSARDPEKRHHVAIFSPVAFKERTVQDASRENWHCYATRQRVEFRSKSFIRERHLAFDRKIFEVDGRLPLMTEGLLQKS